MFGRKLTDTFLINGVFFIGKDLEDIHVNQNFGRGNIQTGFGFESILAQNQSVWWSD